jgi:hypothetical protein
MKDLLEELEAIDTKENHVKTLDNLLTVYLSSKEADNHQERVDILLLIGVFRRHLR